MEKYLCKCGCGQETTWDKRRKRYHRYIKGHYIGKEIKGKPRLLSNVFDVFDKYKPMIDSNGCHNWIGNLNRYGYGRYKHGGVAYLIHRLIWEKEKGKIPDGMCVLHKCDNRKCYNIEHLFLGTKTDNAIDAMSKNRFKNSRLKSNDILSIRYMSKLGYSQYELADRFNTSQSTISQILLGKTWKHIK